MTTNPDEEPTVNRAQEFAEAFGMKLSEAVTGDPAGDVRLVLLYVVVSAGLIIDDPAASAVGLAALLMLALRGVRR